MNGLDVRRGYGAVLRLLIPLGLLGQVAPFFCAAAHPRAASALWPACYGAADAARVIAFNRPLLLANLAGGATALLGLALLLRRQWGRDLEPRIGRERRAWGTLAGRLLLVWAYLALLRLPLGVATLLHLRRFELTDLSALPWLGVQLRAAALPMAIFALEGLLLVACVRLWPRRWWIGSALILFAVFHAGPELFRGDPIDPVWRTTPLPAGPHRAAMESVARRAGVPVEIQVLDRGTRERTLNMLLCGRTGVRRVLVTDTFPAACTPAEAGLALAHELGHQKREISFRLRQKGLALAGLALGLLAANGIARRRLPGEAVRVVPLAMLALSLAGAALSPLSLALSREAEFESDREAVALTGDGQALSQLLCKVGRANLEHPLPPRWIEVLFLDHPALARRMERACAARPR